MNDLKIVIRGGGDTGTAVAWYLFKANFKKIVILEKKKPSSIRREVCFSSAIYENEKIIEGVKAVKCENFIKFQKKNYIPVIIDEQGEFLKRKKIDVLVDAILSKRKPRNYNLEKFFIIGLGPEFIPKINCHVAIETYRGHNLGKIYFSGAPVGPTGIPGEIGGYREERLLRAPIEGEISVFKKIGDLLKKNDIIAKIKDCEILAKIDGILRGIVKDGLYVYKNQKIGDIDPRGIKDYCFTISDRSRCIAGAVLLAILNKFG